LTYKQLLMYNMPMKKPIEDISIISVPVTDQDRAKAFFVEKLGFSLIADNPMSESQRWVQVGPEGSKTSLTLVTWFETMKPGALRGTVLHTSDLDASHAELKSRGVAIDDVEQEPWGRYATFEDVDGNGFVLHEAR
jgi:catechol 2,3-dioxygenase-like lactoylglutathione lyase family enzyme